MSQEAVDRYYEILATPLREALRAREDRNALKEHFDKVAANEHAPFDLYLRALNEYVEADKKYQIAEETYQRARAVYYNL